ncbi:MAG TPA: NTP transferase domain-containing protein [Anaerolineales bacterium]|nr:NTP transferase domain-containing protein [Anaerolineales bacterium]
MDAIVIAGGIPQPDDPLYEFTQGQPKALLDVAGKPMIQWVLDAISGAETVDQVVLISLSEEAGLECSKPITYVPDQGGLLQNVRGGIEKVVEINPQARQVLTVSSDIPTIKSKMIDWMVNENLATDLDIYYTVIPRKVMEERFPESKRSYTLLKDIELCGGDLNMIRASTVNANEELWARIVAARKNVFKQAALLGYGNLILLLSRQLTLAGAVKRVTERMDITGKAVISPYAELGMDVDKPHQLEIVRAELAGVQQA